MENILIEVFERSVQTEESEAQKKGGYLTGRQIAWLIHKNFKFSGESEVILDLCDLLKVELKNDNVQAFDTKWDEVKSSMSKKPRLLDTGKSAQDAA